MKKMRQNTERMWPIGPVIACALSDNCCSCKQTHSLCSASEMTYIVPSGALNSTHSLTHTRCSTVDTASVCMLWAVTHFLSTQYMDL